MDFIDLVPEADYTRYFPDWDWELPEYVDAMEQSTVQMVPNGLTEWFATTAFRCFRADGYLVPVYGPVILSAHGREWNLCVGETAQGHLQQFGSQRGN